MYTLEPCHRDNNNNNNSNNDNKHKHQNDQWTLYVACK